MHCQNYIRLGHAKATSSLLYVAENKCEHDIQYFERVGSSQNNNGHLDT